jgi:hypothetical protein
MGEYEDRYPEAYGHNEETDPGDRHFGGVGLPRQVRGDLPADDRPRPGEAGPGETPPAAIARPMHADMVRTPREICDDIWQQLDHSPFYRRFRHHGFGRRFRGHARRHDQQFDRDLAGAIAGG